jgi:hypothetical protein
MQYLRQRFTIVYNIGPSTFTINLLHTIICRLADFHLIQLFSEKFFFLQKKVFDRFFQLEVRLQDVQTNGSNKSKEKLN